MDLLGLGIDEGVLEQTEQAEIEELLLLYAA